jgi:ribosomal protein S27AE
MWPELIHEIAQHACPNCGSVGVMGLSMSQYRFVCSACHAANIDPFAVGPWDTKQRLLDTVNGEPVSYYVADRIEAEPAEPDENWLAFYKNLFDGSNRRVVKGG